MTELMQFGRDVWRYPLALGAGSFQLFEGAGTGTPRAGTFLSGTYYATDFIAGTPIATGARWFHAIAARLTAAMGSGTVTFAPDDSVSDTDIGQERLKLTWSGGVWGLNPSSNAAWFGAMGFDPSVALITSGADGVIRAPWSYKGAWWSDNPWGGAASSKLYNRVTENAYSSARLWDAQLVQWATQPVRIFAYRHLPAARLLRGRSLDPNRARTANLAVGDPNASFEDVWAALQDPTVAVYVTHDTDALDGFSACPADRFERVQLWQPWPDYLSRLQDMQLGGDYWALELAVRLSAATYRL